MEPGVRFANHSNRRWVWQAREEVRVFIGQQRENEEKLYVQGTEERADLEVIVK